MPNLDSPKLIRKDSYAVYLRITFRIISDGTRQSSQERHSYASCPSLPRASVVRSFTRLS